MVEANTELRMQVAETGNKRQGISAEDVSQCLKDLSEWFKSNAPAYYESKIKAASPVAADEVKSVLEGLGVGGSHLAVSLKAQNGGLQYMNTMIGLTLDQIKTLSSQEGLKSMKAVAFAQDCLDETSVLCVVSKPDGAESVMNIDTSDNSVTEDL